nr:MULTISPECIES: hypothetical protein [Neorhizobium]
MRGLEYDARRHLLEDVLDEQTGAIRISEELGADPNDFRPHACRLGLKGIIAKHSERPYRSGRTGDWLRIKCIHSDSCAIIANEPSTALPGAIGSLLLGARYRDGCRC